MKDIRPKLVKLLMDNFSTPKIAKIAKRLGEPSTTIHYNIKKLEKEGAIKGYNAVFDHKKIDRGHCTFIMVNLLPENYAEPEKVAERVAKDSQVESVDICTGDYELIMKLRTKDIDEYYEYVKAAIKKYGFAKIVSQTSLKQIKSEFL